jgi:hypothetical protein
MKDGLELSYKLFIAAVWVFFTGLLALCASFFVEVLWIG